MGDRRATASGPCKCTAREADVLGVPGRPARRRCWVDTAAPAPPRGHWWCGPTTAEAGHAQTMRCSNCNGTSPIES